MNPNQAPGKLVDVGGYKLHSLSMGEGRPTVILDAGFGGFSLDWCLVQPEIAKTNRVVAYDRAGLGWSEGAPASQPRTSQRMMAELHTILHQADIPGPYVFVGHSLGGLNARIFASRFPQELAGIVMVDATHEDELSARFPAEYVSGWQAQSRVMGAMHGLARLGILRLMLRAGWLPDSLKQHFAKLPPEVRQTYEAFYVDPRAIAALICEMAAMEASYAEARQIGAKPNVLGDMPLAVVKHGLHSGRLPPRASAALVQSYAQAFETVQTELASLSSNSQVFTAESSGHSIQIDQPERVIEAIRWVLDHAKEKRMTNDK